MNEEDEKILNTTTLNTGIAKPIAVSKEEALKLAANQIKQPPKPEPEQRVASFTVVSKEEINEQQVNEVNDLMKSDYVKLVDIKYSKKTYIILFLILGVIIAFIIFEIIYYGGKMS